LEGIVNQLPFSEVKWTDQCRSDLQFAQGVGGWVGNIELMLAGARIGNSLQSLRLGKLMKNPGDLELHHWLIPSRWKWMPQGIRNAAWNRTPMTISQHALADSIRHGFMSPAWKVANPLPAGPSRFLRGVPWGIWGGASAGAVGQIE
jgi:hypothetical protein